MTTLEAPPVVETRSAQVADVRFPQRIIEVIVAPYEQETVIHERSREYSEVVSRGAFDGVERRNDIRVNLEHDRGRLPVGRAVALHPSRAEGLVAEVYMSRSSDGEDALIKAGEGLLGASGGFMLLRRNGSDGPIVPNAEVWETRSRRRLNHLYLHHIALTGEPAYDGARVLDVRSAGADLGDRSPTPLLDELRLAEQAALLADIDRRYGLSR